MKKKKIIIYIVLLFLILAFVPAATGNTNVKAASKSSRVYKARAKRARKRLPKKVKKLLKGYYRPTARISSYKQKGKALICYVCGSIGEGAYEIKVKVNLKNGKCHVIENMVSIPDYFRIKVK